MGYAIVWTVIYKEFFTSPYYEIVVYATSIVALLNAGLFCRLYRSDILRQHKRQHKRTQGTSQTHNNNDLTVDDERKDKDDWRVSISQLYVILTPPTTQLFGDL